MLIGELMSETGVEFGTSGARGRVVDMTDWVCYAYTVGFLRYLRDRGWIRLGCDVGLAGDLRPSTPRILTACARAIVDQGFRPRNFGEIPTPALAAYGFAAAMPTLMVTGSHIPDDRNGIKFNLPTGEILKEDEQAIRAQEVCRPENLFTPEGNFVDSHEAVLPDPDPCAYRAYVERYLSFFPADALAGLRIGLYEHSTVARKAFAEVLMALGAEVTPFGRSESFLPVDTEAVREEDIALAHEQAVTGRFDALVSADGDGDRPLLSDADGNWLRGDVAGILCARALGAQAVVTPVSSNTALEASGSFDCVLRTRIGSPYVIEGMQELAVQGLAPVVGYEANGGFLTATPLEREGHVLPALPTRDALLLVATILAAAHGSGRGVADLLADLPARFTASDRLREFPSELSRARLAGFDTGDENGDRQALDSIFAVHFGPVDSLDRTDGLRIFFASGEIVHLRPSGNAPELRAYTEADTPERAVEMNRRCLEILEAWRE